MLKEKRIPRVFFLVGTTAIIKHNMSLFLEFNIKKIYSINSPSDRKPREDQTLQSLCRLTEPI